MEKKSRNKVHKFKRKNWKKTDKMNGMGLANDWDWKIQGRIILKILNNEFIAKKEKKSKMPKIVKKGQKYKKDDAQVTDICYNCVSASAQFVHNCFRKI